ncbi:MAG TPA: hypothetical protein PKG52_08670 [bacterium]|nr:hypothetical protein [bacterium]HPS30774.1 hypothetical protein [bacterium]
MEKIVFASLFIIFFISCNKDPLVFCEKSKCEMTAIFPGVIEISNKSERNYFILQNSSLNKIDLPDNNTIPFAFSSDMKLMAAKTSQESSIKLNIFDYPEEKVKKTVDLPENFVSIQSGCFLNDLRLAFLHVDETEDLARKYTISISTSPELNDFDSYLIKEENSKEFMSEYLSLGSVVERPVSIQCSGNKLFLITDSIFSDMIQVTVYNFNIEKRSLEYITAYHPVKPDSKINMFFNAGDSTLYIFDKRELISVKENFFPISRKFNESGSLFFSPFTKSGFLMSFFPDKTTDKKKAFRIINIGELPE